MRGEPVHRGIVGIDIEGFNRPEWTDPIRTRQRAQLYRLLDQCLARAHIPDSLTACNDTGDGLLLLVHPEVSKARLLHPLATSMVDRLATANRRRPAAERLRLRVVVHAGEVLADPHGHSGAALNHAGRLLDAHATRTILADSPTADVVLVVSDELYQHIVRHGYPGIDPAGWQPMLVQAKETSTRAWVHLPRLAAQPRLPAERTAPRVGPVSLPIPRELPRPIPDFTGRDRELATLHTLLGADANQHAAAGRTAVGPGRSVVVSAIQGMGGIGKSALAVAAANRLVDTGAFPDGQLYLNLQGATPGLPPLAPLDALAQLLRALGVDPGAIPTAVEEAAARFRSLAADRRLLLVLDNARDAEQVRPLLPGSPTCAVLITSRQPLTTLEGVASIRLDILPPEQALELLGSIAGSARVAAEPQAAADVVGWCGHLPLAIRIAGARLAARPAWPLRLLAERLADATSRLDQLATGDLAVHASFAVSLRALQDSPDPVDRAAAAAFRLLSLPDGPDLSLDAAARLLDQPEFSAQLVMERLVDAQLLESPRPGRYQFHDLLRLYARQHASHQLSEADRAGALTRLLAFYTATAWHTWSLARPGDWRVAAADPRWTAGGLRFADAPAALDWLETERANLLAAVTQAAAAVPSLPTGLAGQLTRAMYGLLFVRSYWHDGVHANQTVLRLARSANDRATQAGALCDLGFLYRRLGRYADAITCHRQSLAIAHERGDRHSQAANLINLGLALQWLGRYAEAIKQLQDGVTIAQELGDRSMEAGGFNSLGFVYHFSERPQDAVACSQQALSIWQELGTRHGEAYGQSILGMAYGRLGRYTEAIACLQASLTVFALLGDRFMEAYSLTSLGVVYQQLGRYGEAIACQHDSLIMKQQLGDWRGQAEALRDLGDALRAINRHQQAGEAWQQAANIYEALEMPEASDIHARLATLPAQAQPSASGIPHSNGPAAASVVVAIVEATP